MVDLTTSKWWPILFPLVPILIGAGTAYFNIFIDSQREFRERISLKRQILTEQLATKLATLLNHLRNITDDQVLRGDGREEADLVGDYSQELIRSFRIFHRMDLILFWVRFSYMALFVTTAIGLLGFLFSIFIPELRLAISYGVVVVVVLQILTVSFIFLAAQRLETYETVG